MPIRLTTVVQHIAPLGSDTLVRGVTVDQRLWVRIDMQSNNAEGDTLDIGFDPARANVFDKAGQARL